MHQIPKTNVPEAWKSLVIRKPQDLDERTCLKFSHTLAYLCLSDTKLRMVPEFLFSRLPNLRWLDLRTNRLKSLPFSIQTHPSLNTLLIDENVFDRLPVYLAVVPYLSHVTFRDNILQFPSEEVLSKGWVEIKQYLLNYMKKNTEEEVKLIRKLRYLCPIASRQIKFKTAQDSNNQKEATHL